MQMKQPVTIYICRHAEIPSDDMIRYCAAQYAGREVVSKLAIHREQGKRPYFVELSEVNIPFQKTFPADRLNRGLPEMDVGSDVASDIFFSVSHSGVYWCCAFSHANVGLDVQIETNAQGQAIARRFFHPDEYTYLRGQSDNHSFFSLWAAKEAYVKYHGYGIDGNFSSFSLIQMEKMCTCCEGVYLAEVAFDEGYHMYLASEAHPAITMKEISSTEITAENME